MELPSDAFKLNDAEMYLDRLSDFLVILDEMQRQPELFPLLRALVDRNRTPGRFLVLGSASPALSRHASESLAGRIASCELTPLTLPGKEAFLLRQNARALPVTMLKEVFQRTVHP